MSNRATPWIAGALAASALLGATAALWQADAALWRARRELLAAETAIAARLLREPDAEAARTFMPRAAPGPAEDLLGEPVVSTRDGALVGRAAVLDPDGWDVTGSVTLRERHEVQGGLPWRWLWGAQLLVAVILYLIARRFTARLAQRGAATPLVRPAALWVATAAVAVAIPVISAERSTNRALSVLTIHRISAAQAALGGHPDLASLAARPSGILDLTGLSFVPLPDAGAESAATASGFAPALAQAIATAPVDRSTSPFRVHVDDVTWAIADVGPIRLVTLPYDVAHAPAWQMAATVLAGLLAGVPLLALATVAGDRRRLRGELAAWSFLAPGLLHLLVFTVGPLLFAAWLSLHRWSLIDPARPFVGAANYLDVLRDGGFWSAVANTALYTLHVPVAMAVALGLALLVRPEGRLSTVARAAFFLPSITSLAAVAMVWQWLLHDQYGLVNAGLAALGLPRVGWLTSPDVALVSLMIVAAWTTLGFQTVLFQAGLTAIPRELYDAARIDGAGRWRQFLHVTLPGLRPTLFFVLVTSVIGAFQSFGLVYVMTEGGPLHATDVAVFHIYEEAWELQRVGSAAAMSWTLFAVIFAVTWLHFRALERRAA